MDIFQSTYSFIIPFRSIKMINFILLIALINHCPHSELVILQKIQNISMTLFSFKQAHSSYPLSSIHLSKRLSKTINTEPQETRIKSFHWKSSYQRDILFYIPSIFKVKT